jgi:hypothetical protein
VRALPRATTIVVPLEHVIDDIRLIARTYKNIRVHFPESHAHKKRHLANDVVLISAWEKRKTPFDAGVKVKFDPSMRRK